MARSGKTSNYDAPFLLTERAGNNAFAWERRGPSPTLRVPSLIDGTFDDVRPGRDVDEHDVVFADVDEHDVLRTCTGLAHLVRTRWRGVPTVVMDNHNHAFYFWYEARRRGLFAGPATLVHIDQHKDMREPPSDFDGATLDDAFHYTNAVVNVGNYIVPAVRAGLVGDIQFVTSGEALSDRSFVARTPKILNIDLDYFALEMSYIPFDEARAFIHAHLATASLVTIATSPFFIDQPAAIDALQRLLHLP